MLTVRARWLVLLLAALVALVPARRRRARGRPPRARRRSSEPRQGVQPSRTARHRADRPAILLRAPGFHRLSRSTGGGVLCCRRRRTYVGRAARHPARRGRGHGQLWAWGSATALEADVLGQAWVGEDSTVASDGKTLLSEDGSPPSYKPYLGVQQANFESRLPGRLAAGLARQRSPRHHRAMRAALRHIHSPDVHDLRGGRRPKTSRCCSNSWLDLATRRVKSRLP